MKDRARCSTYLCGHWAVAPSAYCGICLRRAERLRLRGRKLEPRKPGNYLLLLPREASGDMVQAAEALKDKSPAAIWRAMVDAWERSLK